MISLNKFHADFNDVAKKLKKNIYYPSSKKNKMFFENLKGEEKKAYMEERNLKEYNINTLDIIQFRTLSKDTQTKILGELIAKYGSNVEIERHTNFSRHTLSKLRKELGLAPAKPGNYDRKSNPNTAPRTRTAPISISPSVTEEPQNLIEIKIFLNDCSGADLQKKLESVGLFLEDNKKYHIDFVLKEIENNNHD